MAPGSPWVYRVAGQSAQLLAEALWLHNVGCRVPAGWRRLAAVLPVAFANLAAPLWWFLYPDEGVSITIAGKPIASSRHGQRAASWSPSEAGGPTHPPAHPPPQPHPSLMRRLHSDLALHLQGPGAWCPQTYIGSGAGGGGGGGAAAGAGQSGPPRSAATGPCEVPQLFFRLQLPALQHSW